MTEKTAANIKSASTAPSRLTVWSAYAAALWAFVFAAMSFYWAVGGLVGAETLGEGMKELALVRDAELITLTWVTGVLKVIGGLVALALVQSWGRNIPRRLLQIAAWVGSILLILYGIGNFVQHALMATGSMRIPDLLGSVNAVRWHLLFWDPFWTIGGGLFVLAAWYYGRR